LIFLWSLCFFCLCGGLAASGLGGLFDGLVTASSSWALVLKRFPSCYPHMIVDQCHLLDSSVEAGGTGGGSIYGGQFFTAQGGRRTRRTVPNSFVRSQGWVSGAFSFSLF
jgi:hypothetical protein